MENFHLTPPPEISPSEKTARVHGSIMRSVTTRDVANDVDKPAGILLTELDQLCLAEAKRAGITSPSLISRSDVPSPEMMALDMQVLETRIQILEQRLQWICERYFRDVL